MTESEQRALWKQYAEAHASAQETFDSSVRTLAAAAVAVTVSLVAALEEVTASAAAAVVMFLVSLGVNLVSYVTAQLDLRRRMKFVGARDWSGSVKSYWTTCTVILNVLAGASLLGGGCFLAYFVATSV